MAKVTGLTASRMYQIEQASVVSGKIENEDELILYTRGGTRIRAGVVKGGTAEWIQEYKPIIDDHGTVLEETKETVQEVYEKLQEHDPVVEAADNFYTNELPVLRDDVNSAVNDSINAIQKANDTIKMVEIEYALGSDLVTAPTSGWTEEYPVRGTNQYIWMRSKITRNDGKPATYSGAVPVTGDRGNQGIQGVPGEKGQDGIPGADGVGLKATVIDYAVSASNTVIPTSGWSSKVPTLVKGSYLWTRTKWTYTDDSEEVGYSLAYIAKDGNTGNDGIAGKDGVGIKTTTITYAQSTSGTTAPTSGWTAQPPTASAGNYVWTKTSWAYTDNTTEIGYSVGKIGETGAKGDKGEKGDAGADGLPGKDGVGLVSTEIRYAKSTSGTVAPTSGWQDTVPASIPGQFLWTRTVWTYTDSSSETGYSVAQWGATGSKGDKGAKGDTGSDGIAGKDGVGITSTVITYTQSTSGTTAPTTGWVENPPTPIAGRYIWTKTVWTYSDGTTETGYSVGKIGDTGAKGDKGDTGEQGETGAKGDTGEQGVSVESITPYFASFSTEWVGEEGASESILRMGGEEVSRNYSIRSRGIQAWNTNNSTTNPLQINQPVPAPHPLGIDTANKQTSTGTTYNLGTLYNIDGTFNSSGGVTPTLYRGAWVYVNASGYKARVSDAGSWLPLPANTWTFVRSDGARASSLLVVITETGALASTTDTVWFTGSIASDQPLPYFDGSTQPYPELVEAFLPEYALQNGESPNFIPEGTTPINRLTWVSAGRYFTASTTTSTGAFSFGTVGLTTSKSVASCEIRVASEEYAGTKVQWQYAGAKFMDGDPLEVTTDWQKITSNIIPGPITMGLRVTNFAPQQSKADFWIKNLTLNPFPTWSTTEPSWQDGSTLYRTELIVFDNGQYYYTPLTQVSSYQAATQAIEFANMTISFAENLVVASIEEPEHSLGRIWLKLVKVYPDDESNDETYLESIFQSDGEIWSRYGALYDIMLVPKEDGGYNVLDKSGLDVNNVLAQTMRAHIFSSDKVRAGEISIGAVGLDELDFSMGDAGDIVAKASSWNKRTLIEPGRIAIASSDSFGEPVKVNTPSYNGSLSTASGFGQVIEVDDYCTIEYVTVYGTEGSDFEATIELRDRRGGKNELIKTWELNLKPGRNDIRLDANLEPSDDGSFGRYHLGAVATRLSRKAGTDIAYPMNSGTFRIVGYSPTTYASILTAGYYYYFFEMYVSGFGVSKNNQSLGLTAMVLEPTKLTMVVDGNQGAVIDSDRGLMSIPRARISNSIHIGAHLMQSIKTDGTTPDLTVFNWIGDTEG